MSQEQQINLSSRLRELEEAILAIPYSRVSFIINFTNSLLPVRIGRTISNNLHYKLINFFYKIEIQKNNKYPIAIDLNILAYELANGLDKIIADELHNNIIGKFDYIKIYFNINKANGQMLPTAKNNPCERARYKALKIAQKLFCDVYLEEDNSRAEKILEEAAEQDFVVFIRDNIIWSKVEKEIISIEDGLKNLFALNIDIDNEMEPDHYCPISHEVICNAVSVKVNGKKQPYAYDFKNLQKWIEECHKNNKKPIDPLSGEVMSGNQICYFHERRGEILNIVNKLQDLNNINRTKI